MGIGLQQDRGVAAQRTLAIAVAAMAGLYTVGAHLLLTRVRWADQATLLRVWMGLCAHVPGSLLPADLAPQVRPLILRWVWALLHVCVYVPLPLWAARACTRPPADVGLGVAHSRRCVALLITCMALWLPVLLIFSRTAGFAAAYPMFWPPARVHAAPLAWLGALFALALHLLSVELFFRRALPALLTPALGRAAGWCALLPYVATHRYAPELIASLPFGILLWQLRARCGSVWPGYALHLCVAVSLEVCALWRHGLW